MKSTLNDGGPAFPGPATTTNPQGMSLRDYFAGQALVPLLALMNASDTKGTRDGVIELLQTMSEISYAAADAMLATREDTL